MENLKGENFLKVYLKRLLFPYLLHDTDNELRRMIT